MTGRPTTGCRGAGAARHGRPRGERAVVAGADGLLIGTLVLLTGTVLVVNLWSAVATRSGVDAMAREYLRAWTAADSAASAPVDAHRALERTAVAAGVDPGALRVAGPDPATFGPCAPAEVTIHARVPAVRAPFVGTLGELHLTVHHADLVPPHRELETGGGYDPTATPCGG